MEKYSFRIHVKGADPGGYHALFRIIRSYLHKFYPESHIKLDRDYIVTKNIGKEGKAKNEIMTELKELIDKNTISWKKKGVTLEDVTERVLKEEPQLSNTARDIMNSLKETVRFYQDQLEDYRSNEDAYIDEIKRLEEIVSEQQKTIKDYEREDRRYIKEVDEKVKTLEREVQRSKLLLMRFKRGIEHYFEGKEERKLTKLDYIKKALEEGNSTHHEILDYFRRNQIQITENYLTVLLSTAAKNKEIRRIAYGKYNLS